MGLKINDDPIGEVNKFEKEIDNIVYHIYELTYDEILIVDPETPITKEEYGGYVINIED